MIRHAHIRRGTAAVIYTLCAGALAQVQDTTTSFLYDKMGNVTQVTNPLNKVTTLGYDRLSRQTSMIDPAQGITTYDYDGLDRVIRVTDARSVVTSYEIDGLGNLKKLTSADTGVANSTFDEVGNLRSKTDAKLQKTSYQYDVLDRLTLVTHHDGATAVYAYDLGANGVGRLGKITDSSGSISYAYDQHGRTKSETRVIAGASFVTSYDYNAAGQLSAMTYPSGRKIDYVRDTVGRITALTTMMNGSVVPLVSEVSYAPFGSVQALRLGNGLQQTRGRDLDGRITSFGLSSKTVALTYDAASRIKSIADMANPSGGTSYGYDTLDRLTSVLAPGSAQTYSYDLVGNRKQKVNNSVTTPYTYGGPGNRLSQVGSQAIATDMNGSITNKGNATFAYDARGRMVSANTAIGHVQYTINSLGQRVRKVTPTDITVFHYDTSGKLIVETTTTGGVAATKEYIYLGDMPVAVLK
jgi:YD repeat-containing protein